MLAMKRTLVVLLITLTLIEVSCTSKTQFNALPTPTLIEPKQGTGGMRGVIDNIEAFWQKRTVYVFAAEYVGNEQGEGIYVLEPSIHPYTTVEAGGFFQINNMPPGEYVLVIGPSPEEAITVRRDAKAVIYKVAAGDVTDIGSIHLSW